MSNVLFARVGWMKRYKGPQGDDEKPVGGGSYTKEKLGHEAFNFLPLDGEMLGYFQPQLAAGRNSTIALERIRAGFSGAALEGVLVVFVATHPNEGGQRIIGWFRNATVYRHEQPSKAAERNQFSYFAKVPADHSVLLPDRNRTFRIPSGSGAFGQANVCYTLDYKGQRKGSSWISDAINYVNSYAQENIALEPESETDRVVEEMVGISIERGAGFQSNPRIRRAIEDHAMKRAKAHLDKLGYKPKDKHKTESYDFLCDVSGSALFVEVKGTQDRGESVSLTPKEVDHALQYANSALFIVHSVKVAGKRRPKASGGKDFFLNPWDIRAGTLKPRGFVFALPKASE